MIPCSDAPDIVNRPDPDIAIPAARARTARTVGTLCGTFYVVCRYISRYGARVLHGPTRVPTERYVRYRLTKKMVTLDKLVTLVKVTYWYVLRST